MTKCHKTNKIILILQAPLPEPKWDHIFEAIEENVRCPQRIGDTIVIGQEDCLSLNVYVPVNSFSNGNLPVMVFIHGGGYYDGSGLPAIYGAEYLMKHEVVLVTINYRLNIQGFLCLGIKEAPGNVALKDQVAALKWIQKNIASFSGDPDNVTIFGESAGSSSVSYHLLSPMSKGLFHKAILQSGSSMSPWANQYDPINMAHLLARELGYNTKNPYELYKIFMNTTYQELIVTRVPRPEGNIIISELLFIPCVEKEIPGVESFITDFPYNIFKKGQFNKVPIMTGYNSKEGYFFAGKENDTTIANMDIRKAMPKNLHFPSDEERIKTADRVKRHYLGDKTINKDTMVEFSEFEGDPNFKFPALVEIDFLLKWNNNPVYGYEFKYCGHLNLAKSSVSYNHAPGATHADDLFYLFNPKCIPTPQAIFEKTMIKKMTTMWTNFAIYG